MPHSSSIRCQDFSLCDGLHLQGNSSSVIGSSPWVRFEYCCSGYAPIIQFGISLSLDNWFSMFIASTCFAWTTRYMAMATFEIVIYPYY